MPSVGANPNKLWQRARVFAPHAAGVLALTGDGGDWSTEPHAELLTYMGQYCQYVNSRYS